jgi:hypothetical protein
MDKQQKVTHTLKCNHEYFIHSWEGLKPFEIRNNDKAYQKGDIVMLKEIMGHAYTGRIITGTIGFVTTFVQKDGFVVFSLIKTKKESGLAI